VCEKIDALWGDFLNTLEKRVKSTAREMIGFLDSVRTSLESIKEEIKDKACKAITEITLGASRAHRTALKSIRENWEPAFTKALKENGTHQLPIPLHSTNMLMQGMESLGVSASF